MYLDTAVSVMNWWGARKRMRGNVMIQDLEYANDLAVVSNSMDALMSHPSTSFGAPPPRSFQICLPKVCLFGLKQSKETQTTSFQDGGLSLSVPTSPSDT